MKRHLGYVVLAAAMLAASPTVAGERYKLRAPGGLSAQLGNDVGVWKTADAARKARASIGAENVTSPNLECIVPPGIKAEVIRREKSVAYVRASNAAFGGCRGYVKTDFLSAN
ncbi:hypothetical protein GGD57_005389 [Rhizobium esperanzae]|uniref:Succinate dehydrogenase n=1 Tax=Rhizobium esperanzae TaxID=1967781 RepID=A0A7W6R8F2_9HYPH|nr:hypothetical protein [Rhizobium esperanzae]